MEADANTPGTMDAADILAVDDDEPERVFPGDRDGVLRLARRLMAAWHPDACTHPRAEEVAKKIGALKESALDRIARDAWRGPARVRFSARDGRAFDLTRTAVHDVAEGRLHVGDTTAVLEVGPGEADLADAVPGALDRLRFADAAMREQMEPRLTRVKRAAETSGGGRFVALAKPRDTVALPDLLEAAGPRLDPRHAAWLVSALLNVACYLEWSGTVHAGITPAAIMVSPERHEIALVGGWSFAAPAGGRLAALPEPVRAAAPDDLVDRRRADPRVDVAAVKAIARSVTDRAAAPLPVAEWAELPPERTAVDAYAAWAAARDAGFGERRFVPFGLTADDVKPPRPDRARAN